LDRLIRPRIDTSRPASTPQDLALEESVRSLVDAINLMPSFRFGWRSGAPTPMRLFTHKFMHADFMHLFGNMLLLWIAGGLLECFWRRWAFPLLYLFSGFAGLFAFYLSSPHSLTPLVGASGAIAGLMGAFVVGYPRVRIKLFWFTMFFFRPRWGSWLAPAWAVLPLWAGLELFKALLDMDGESGVAYWAHVGGFVFGAIAALVAKRFHLVAEDAGYDRAEPAMVIPGTIRPSSVLPLPRDHAEKLPLPAMPVENTERPKPQRPPPRELELSELRETSDDIIER
jgi:membrane associated rhomboid family serine protease